MSPSDKKYDLTYYTKSALAGGICCGITHGAVCPVDVVKTRIQLEPQKYNKGMIGGFKQVIGEEGVMALSTGLGATAIGYFIQGWFKFGGVEFFKIKAAGALGDAAPGLVAVLRVGLCGAARFALRPVLALLVALVAYSFAALGIAAVVANVGATVGHPLCHLAGVLRLVGALGSVRCATAQRLAGPGLVPRPVLGDPLHATVLALGPELVFLVAQLPGLLAAPGITTGTDLAIRALLVHPSGRAMLLGA